MLGAVGSAVLPSGCAAAVPATTGDAATDVSAGEAPSGSARPSAEISTRAPSTRALTPWCAARLISETLRFIDLPNVVAIASMNAGCDLKIRPDSPAAAGSHSPGRLKPAATRVMHPIER